MSPFRRWTLVAAGVALMIGLPLAVRARPVSADPVPAATLLSRIESARDTPYSGFVQAQGTLALPIAAHFTDVATLLGGATDLRVWWRTSQDWRVDKLLPTGETDLIHHEGVTTAWDYEKQEASTNADPDIRLPRSADLLPPEIARRVLQDIAPGEISRLGSRRIAGRPADGLRVSPAAPQASIDHVDLWADRASGVVLRVDLYGAGATTPAVTSQFSQFDPQRPAASTTAFTPAFGVKHTFGDVLDIADAANQYAPFRPPTTLAGLPKSPSSRRAVGVYGTGVTQVMAVPLRGRDARPLEEQLMSTGARQVDGGVLLRVGVLGVLLTDEYDGHWLVTGSLTNAALVQAGHDLVNGVRFR